MNRPSELAALFTYAGASYDHAGCQRILRKVRDLRGSEEAKAWARQQPWWPRVVDAKRDARWWIWWVRP